jgi:hypothetical protein
MAVGYVDESMGDKNISWGLDRWLVGVVIPEWDEMSGRLVVCLRFGGSVRSHQQRE